MASLMKLPYKKYISADCCITEVLPRRIYLDYQRTVIDRSQEPAVKGEFMQPKPPVDPMPGFHHLVLQSRFLPDDVRDARLTDLTDSYHTGDIVLVDIAMDDALRPFQIRRVKHVSCDLPNMYYGRMTDLNPIGGEIRSKSLALPVRFDEHTLVSDDRFSVGCVMLHQTVKFKMSNAGRNAGSVISVKRTSPPEQVSATVVEALYGFCTLLEVSKGMQKRRCIFASYGTATSPSHKLSIDNVRDEVAKRLKLKKPITVIINKSEPGKRREWEAIKMDLD